jgi:hypothetical protein
LPGAGARTDDTSIDRSLTLVIAVVAVLFLGLVAFVIRRSDTQVTPPALSGRVWSGDGATVRAALFLLVVAAVGFIGYSGRDEVEGFTDTSGCRRDAQMATPTAIAKKTRMAAIIPRFTFVVRR